MSRPRPQGVFVGLATLDLVQHVAHVPEPNAKATATWQELAAGGPALNAAVVFAALGGAATLVTRVGEGPVADLVREDLRTHGVDLVDQAEPGWTPSVSSIVVDAGTGDRQIVSTDARPAEDPPVGLPAEAGDALVAADVVLFDGHHADLAEPLATRVPDVVPCVLDAGRWKPVMAALVGRCGDVICSADFRLDGGTDPAARGDGLLTGLLARGARVAAISDGAAPIRWRSADEGAGVVDPPAVPRVVDTLGAGDALHGAYAFARAVTGPHGGPDACLTFAAAVASRSCGSAGTRSWLPRLGDEPLPDPNGTR